MPLFSQLSTNVNILINKENYLNDNIFYRNLFKNLHGEIKEISD